MAERKLPEFGKKLIQWILPRHRAQLILGDFEEYLACLPPGMGKTTIKLAFWKQFLLSLPAMLMCSFQNSWALLIHALKISTRSIIRNMGHYSLNVSGLAIGIASFVVIMLYVAHERSYDLFHKNANRIYRVLDFRKVDGVGEESSSAPTPLAEAMKNDFPDQIQAAVRFFNFQAPSMVMAYEEENEVLQFNESGVYFVDPSFFEVFDFKLEAGREELALRGPNKVLLTRRMAKKYFDDEDPMGKTLKLEGQHQLTVSGILENSPANSHIQFDFLISFETLDSPEVIRTRLRKSWIWNPSWTYLQLAEAVEPEDLESQFPAFVRRYFPESRRDRVKLYLQPLTSIHLNSQLDYEMRPNSDEIYVHIFTVIGYFVLLISYFNFINLTITRFSVRSKEIGLRKLLGTTRTHLIRHLLNESFMVNLIAVLVSIPLILFFLDLADKLLMINLQVDSLALPWSWLEIIAIYVLASLISGIYPAYVLSSFNPMLAIKGNDFKESCSIISVRKLMVTGQFTLSVILMIGTLVAYHQFNYLSNRSTGFNSANVLLLPSLRSPIMDHYAVFKERLLMRPEIAAVTTAEEVPGVKHQTGLYEAFPGEEPSQFPRLVVHDDFAKTLGIPMAAGRDFSEGFSNDSEESVVINEMLAKQLGFTPEEAIGQKFDGESIVGVTQDFHFTSYHRAIGPFVMQKIGEDERSLSFSARYIAINLNREVSSETLDYIQNTWNSLAPSAPFEFLQLQQLIDSQYESEDRLGTLTKVFAVLSIFIACLGLYGLSAHAMRRKIKELGIRKVLGASMSNLMMLISSSFLQMVVVAIIIASPLAYWALGSWLEGFAYHIDLNVYPFLFAGLAALVIVIATVGYHILQATRVNPVESLRDE